jgi:hypothetical protein
MSNARNRPKISATMIWSAFGAVSFVGVFWLPYHVAARHPVFSDASRHGYNTSVAVLCMLVMVLVGTGLHLTLGRGSEQVPPAAPDDQRMPLWPLKLVLGVQALALLFETWLFWSNDSGFFEATYFSNRLQCLKLGLKPYSGFEFVYGPLLLYPADWIRRALHFPLDGAYVALVCLYVMAGTSMLWPLVQSSIGDRRQKMAAFFLLGSTLSLSLALQYTLPRFLASSLGVLAIAELLKRKTRWLLQALVAVCITAAIFGISSEVGIAFIAGVVACWFVGYFGDRRVFYVIGCYLLMLLCLLPLMPRTALDALFSFSKGGNAYFLVPSAFLVFYLVSVLAFLPYSFAFLIRRLRERRNDNAWAYRLPALAGISVTALAMMPGAMARADVLHVPMYGTPTFLLALLHPWKSRSLKLAYFALFGVIFLVLTPLNEELFFVTHRQYQLALESKIYTEIQVHPHSMLEKVGERAQGLRWPKRLESWRPSNMIVEQYPLFASETPVCDPFNEYGYSTAGFVTSNEPWAGNFHNDTRSVITPNYYFNVISVYTDEQVRRWKQSVSGCRYLVAPTVPADDLKSHDSYMPIVLWWPWLPPLSPHAPPDPTAPLRSYVLQHCKPIRQVNESTILCENRP